MVEVTDSIMAFAVRGAKEAVLLMAPELGLDEFQTKDFNRGFLHGLISDTYNKHSQDDEHYVRAFGMGKRWRKAMPRKGEQTR